MNSSWKGASFGRKLKALLQIKNFYRVYHTIVNSWEQQTLGEPADIITPDSLVRGFPRSSHQP
jgi:hypothetical protein